MTIAYNCPICGSQPAIREYSIVGFKRKTIGCPSGCSVVINKFNEETNIVIMPDKTDDETMNFEWNNQVFLYKRRVKKDV